MLNAIEHMSSKGNKISISSIRIQENSINCRLAATVKCGDKCNDLWFEVSYEYKSYLTWEVSDAFVVGLLPYIARNGGVCELEVPVSDELKFKIEHELSSLLPMIDDRMSGIVIRQPDVIPVELSQGQAIGTGISCGVDSLCTLCEYLSSDVPQSMKLTHLVFMDSGQNSEARLFADELFRKRLQQAEAVAKHLSIPLIVIRSNLIEFSMDYVHENIHAYRSTSTVLALQKLFRRYFYASGVHIKNFKLSKIDTAYYESFLFYVFSTSVTTFYSTLSTLYRFERSFIVANSPLSLQKFLNVCVREEHNCGICFKCIRTMFQLQCLGVLNNFKNVFNIESFLKWDNRIHIYRTLAYDKEFWEEYFLLRKKENMFCIYCGLVINKMASFILAPNKIYKKILAVIKKES